jgi:hypothetical protein
VRAAASAAAGEDDREAGGEVVSGHARRSLRDLVIEELRLAMIAAKYEQNFDALPALHLTLLVDDLVDMCREEKFISVEAVRMLRERIGGWKNVESYCATLAAGHARRTR